MEDEAIIELLFARSERAVAELDAKYGPLLRSLALRLLADEEDAAECVSDAYFAAWKAIPPERPESLAAWLCRVVRNGAVSVLRKRGALRRGGGPCLPLDELAESLAAPGSVSDELEAKELAEGIRRFLETLPRENRIIFLRRYWFEDSIREISERCGLSEGAVRLRLMRLRRRLRDWLKSQEADI